MKFSEYKFPSQYDAPFKHQVLTVEFLIKNMRAFLLSTMGTGKTLSSLWACDFLLLNRLINKVLVVAPLSILESTWAEEIVYNIPHRRYKILHGSRKVRIERLNEEAHFYIINHDGIKTIEDELKRVGFDVIIIDELTAYKNYSADRTKCMYRIANPRPKEPQVKAVWGMSGSPTANSPIDAFGQARVVRPKNPLLTPYFTRFRNQVMYQLDEYTYVPRPGWEKVISTVLSPSIRFVLRDCVDLPPMIQEKRKIDMSKEQSRLYQELTDEFIAEYKQGLITASTAGVRGLKWLQISSGVVKDNDGIWHRLDCKKKFAELFDVYEQSENKKIIVFSTFKESVDMITDFFNDKDIKAAKIRSEVKQSDRNEAFNSFKRGDLKVLVMQPQTAAHGLNLQVSNTIVWFAPIPSNEKFQQAMSRIERPGQKRTQLMIRLSCSEAEDKVYASLDNKQKISETFLELIKSKAE